MLTIKDIIKRKIYLIKNFFLCNSNKLTLYLQNVLNQEKQTIFGCQ